ncbi:MAG: hypothetical protein ACREBG_18715 [Pyrinomonadaceae bacterium]
MDAEKELLDAQKALADAQKALEQTKVATAQQLSDLQNQKALADAQKALADAQKGLEQTKAASAQQVSDLQNQKALADAQRALIDSQKALDQSKSTSAQQVTELQNQKALVDAQKALAEAQTQSALAKLIGEVKAGPYSGTVDMKEKAGTEEGLLLAARAVKECAEKVAKAVEGKATKFYVFAAKEFPAFQRLLTFRFRKEMIKQAFAAAGIKKPEAAGPELVATPALISAGLDAFSKILGFFKTDYTIGGTEAKLDESLLLFSVAGKLSGEVHLPLVYEPNAHSSTVAALTSELAELVDLRSRTATEAIQAKDQIADLEKRAADPANAAMKDELLATAAALKPRLDQLNGVIALYDSFASSLTTPDSNGAVPLTAVAQEFAVDAALKDGGAVLLLRLENSGGGYLLKKNLLTGIWKMPLYHMGGATVAFLLLSGLEGKVLAGDVILVYGGFVRTDNLRDELAK